MQNVVCSVTRQNALNVINDWAGDWQLHVSVNKCSVLHVSTRPTAFDVDKAYYLDGTGHRLTKCRL